MQTPRNIPSKEHFRSTDSSKVPEIITDYSSKVPEIIIDKIELKCPIELSNEKILID